MNVAPAACSARQLGEHQLLGLLVDHERAIAARPAADRDRALAGRRVRGEHRREPADDPLAGRQPVRLRRFAQIVLLCDTAHLS